MMPVVITLPLPSVLAILYAAAEVYPKPTIAPKDVRSTNQLRVFLPKIERIMASIMMKMMLSGKVKEALDKVVDGIVDASNGKMPEGFDPSQWAK